MFGLSKIYTMGIVAIVAIVAVFGIWMHGNSTGYDSCQLEHKQAQLDQLAEDAETVKDIEDKADERTKIIVKWKTRIKKIPVSDCLKRFPEDRVNNLRKAYKALNNPQQ